MEHCPYCRAGLAEQARFCGKCGQTIPQHEQPAQGFTAVAEIHVPTALAAPEMNDPSTKKTVVPSLALREEDGAEQPTLRLNKDTDVNIEAFYVALQNDAGDTVAVPTQPLAHKPAIDPMTPLPETDEALEVAEELKQSALLGSAELLSAVLTTPPLPPQITPLPGTPSIGYMPTLPGTPPLGNGPAAAGSAADAPHTLANLPHSLTNALHPAGNASGAATSGSSSTTFTPGSNPTTAAPNSGQSSPGAAGHTGTSGTATSSPGSHSPLTPGNTPATPTPGGSYGTSTPGNAPAPSTSGGSHGTLAQGGSHSALTPGGNPSTSTPASGQNSPGSAGNARGSGTATRAHGSQGKLTPSGKTTVQSRLPSSRRAPSIVRAAPRPVLGTILKGVAILVVTGAVLLGGLISLGLTVWAPRLSLSGGSKVIQGGSLVLRGRDFLPNGSVTLTRDNGIPFSFSQHASPTQFAQGIGRLEASGGLVVQTQHSNGASNIVAVRGDGTFTISLPIASSLPTGTHRVSATEAPTHRSVSLSFVVIQPAPTTASTATITITPTSQNVNIPLTISGVTGTPSSQQVQAHQLSATTQTYSQTTNATGKGTIPATSATGFLTIYNNTYPGSPVTVSAGSVYPCNDECQSPYDSMHMVIDQTVIVSPDGRATVSAHVEEAGSSGNIYASGGFYYYNSSLSISNANSFGGGQDSKSYTYVQQSDINGATNSLISAKQPDATQMLQGQVQANERLADTPQCTPKSSANHQAGDHAKSVTVNVSFVCAGETYDYDGALQLARQVLSQQEAGKLGANYKLIGQIIPTLNSATSDGQTVTITVAAKGIWVYQISSEWEQIWKHVIAGEHLQDAQSLLLDQQGVAQATIQLSGPLIQVLPADWHAITIVVQTVTGF